MDRRGDRASQDRMKGDAEELFGSDRPPQERYPEGAESFPGSVWCGRCTGALHVGRPRFKPPYCCYCGFYLPELPKKVSDPLADVASELAAIREILTRIEDGIGNMGMV